MPLFLFEVESTVSSKNESEGRTSFEAPLMISAKDRTTATSIYVLNEMELHGVYLKQHFDGFSEFEIEKTLLVGINQVTGNENIRKDFPLEKVKLITGYEDETVVLGEGGARIMLKELF